MCRSAWCMWPKFLFSTKISDVNFIAGLIRSQGLAKIWRGFLESFQMILSQWTRKPGLLHSRDQTCKAWPDSWGDFFSAHLRLYGWSDTNFTHHAVSLRDLILRMRMRLYQRSSGGKVHSHNRVIHYVTILTARMSPNFFTKEHWQCAENINFLRISELCS